MNKQKEKIVSQLTEEKAKRDASYEYGKKDIEPIASSAFKGALGTAVASRVIKDTPRLDKLVGMKGKREAVLVGAGTLLGAIGGKVYNDKKVDKASNARDWLADKRKKTDYIKKNRAIYKEATIDNNMGMAGDAYDIADHARRVKNGEAAQSQTWKEIAKDTGMYGTGAAAIGGAFGGIKGARIDHKAIFGSGKIFSMLPGAKGKALVTALKAGGLFAGGGLLSGIASKGTTEAENAAGIDKSSPIATAALGGAAMVGGGALVDPYVNRAAGALSAKIDEKNKSTHMFDEINKGYKPEAEKSTSHLGKAKEYIGQGMKRYISSPVTSRIPDKVKPYLPFGAGRNLDFKESMIGYDKGKMNIKAGQGVTKGIMSGVGMGAIKRASRFGLGGAAIFGAGTGIWNMIKNRNKGLTKESGLSGREMVRAKKSEANEEVNKSSLLSAGRKGAFAAGAYYVGNHLGGHAAGVNAVKATLIYSVPKTLKEEYDKNKAATFLNMPYGKKLSVIHSEDKDNRLGVSELMKAYVGTKFIDKFLPNEVTVKSDAKKKFDINSAL